MFFRKITMACAGAALMAVPVSVPTSRAQADDLGAFVGGAIIGGVVGHAIGKNHSKKKRVVKKRYVAKKKAPTVSAAVRQERRDIQTALNYFNFPAGPADGVLGRKSRAAISSYQAHLGYPATGQLTQYEKEFLLTSYRRAIAGGAVTAQQIAGNPLGPKGLLDTYRAEAGQVTTVTTTVQPVAPAAAATTVVAVAPQPQVLQPQVLQPTVPTTTLAAAAPAAAAPTPAPALPTFMAEAEPASLASHCTQVSLLTNTNGGFITEATLVDANYALNEQFCLARTYAIRLGEQAAAKVSGATPQQIEAQCTAFGPVLKPYVASLSAKTKEAVVADVVSYATTTGQTNEQLGGIASICLSVGYRTDNMEVAAGSALLLAALGQPAYGELIGHHLAQGFGVQQSVSQAMPWYEASLSAVETGTPAVFNPGDPTRTGLLRKATANLSGAPTTPLVQPAAAALPTFSLTE